MDRLWLVVEWVGRLMFVALFIVSGFNHLTQTQMVAGYAASKHVPAPVPGTIVSGLMLVGGGILILIGWHPIAGAAAVFLFLMAAAFLIHNYWTLSDPMMKAGDRAQFWKNISLAGAALLYGVARHRGAF